MIVDYLFVVPMVVVVVVIRFDVSIGDPLLFLAQSWGFAIVCGGGWGFIHSLKEGRRHINALIFFRFQFSFLFFSRFCSEKSRITFTFPQIHKYTNRGHLCGRVDKHSGKLRAHTHTQFFQATKDVTDEN